MKNLAILGLALLLPSLAMADVIAEFDVSKNKKNWMNAKHVADGTTVSNLTSVGATVLTGYKGTYCAKNWGTGQSRDQNRYYEFSVTADEGMGVTFDSLDFALLRGDYGKKGHGAQQWSLYASLDNFANPSAEVNLGSYDLAGSRDNELVCYSTSLDQLGTQTGTVTFRLYGYDQTYGCDYAGFGDTNKHGLNGTGSSVLLNGSVCSMPTGVATAPPVPEPAICALLGIGGFGLFVRRRRRTA